jgi:hypothetical protein
MSQIMEELCYTQQATQDPVVIGIPHLLNSCFDRVRRYFASPSLFAYGHPLSP